MPSFFRNLLLNLTFSLRCFKVFAFSNVANGRQRKYGIRGSIGAQTYLDWKFRSIGAACQKFQSYSHWPDRRGLEVSLKMLSMSIAIAGRQKAGYRLSDQLTRAVSEQAISMSIGKDDQALRIHQDHGVGNNGEKLCDGFQARHLNLDYETVWRSIGWGFPPI